MLYIDFAPHKDALQRRYLVPLQYTHRLIDSTFLRRHVDDLCAMTDKEFEHSELRVSSTNSNLSLSMSSSFTLTLPAMPAESLTATDISFLSRTGQLWISKANYCRFEIISSIEGADLDGRIVQKCINSVVECPVCIFPSRLVARGLTGAALGRAGSKSTVRTGQVHPYNADINADMHGNQL